MFFCYSLIGILRLLRAASSIGRATRLHRVGYRFKSCVAQITHSVIIVSITITVAIDMEIFNVYYSQISLVDILALTKLKSRQSEYSSENGALYPQYLSSNFSKCNPLLSK